MSTLRTNNLQNPDSSNVNIELTQGSGAVVAGVTTFSSDVRVSGNLNVGGVLTYEDVTNIDAVGIITAQSGVHIDDSITHLGDTNTKIRFPAADTITAETGGLERVRITSAGKVGIGTESPSTMLEVGSQSQTLAGAITISNGETIAGGSGPLINLKHGPAGGTQRTHQIYSYIGDLRIVADSNENMEFHTGGSESLRITSTGQMGLGTNNPNRLLQVDGASGGNGQVLISTNGAFSGTDTADLSFRVYANPSNGNAHNPQAQIQAVGTGSYDAALTFKTAVGGSDNNTPLERLRITSTGQMGLGTNDPNSYGGSVKLAVANTSGTCGLSIVSATNGDGNLYYADGTSGDATYRGYIRYNHTLDQFRIGVAGAEKLRITSAGDVNIGPAANANGHGLLTLSQTALSAFNALVIQQGNTQFAATDGLHIGIDAGVHAYIKQYENRDIYFTTGNPNSEKLRIDSNGKLIATQSSSNIGLELHATGSGKGSQTKYHNDHGEAYVGTAGDTSGDFLVWQQSNANLLFATSGTEKIRVENNGNVSINWGNPLTWPKVTIRDAGSTISSGNAINGSSMKGIHLANSNNDDTSLGLWATTGDAHWSGISFQRNNSASTWGTDIRFYTHEDATNDLTYARERLRIDPGGRVTMPYQPCFWATSNSGSTDTGEGYTGIFSNQLEQANVNIGNHYNTSTGVFTCPVAGTYEFHGQGLIRYQGGTGRAELTFYKNGSNTVNRSYGYTYITTTNDHDNLHVMGYITCAKNDQIDLRVYAMDSGIDCYFAEGLGYFAGRLVQ